MLLLKKVPLQNSDIKWETKKLSFQSLWLFLSVTSWLCLKLLWFFPRKIWLMAYVMLQMFTKQILQITIFAFSSIFLSYCHTSSESHSYNRIYIKTLSFLISYLCFLSLCHLFSMSDWSFCQEVSTRGIAFWDSK